MIPIGNLLMVKVCQRVHIQKSQFHSFVQKRKVYMNGFLMNTYNINKTATNKIPLHSMLMGTSEPTTYCSSARERQSTFTFKRITVIGSSDLPITAFFEKMVHV